MWLSSLWRGDGVVNGETVLLNSFHLCFWSLAVIIRFSRQQKNALSSLNQSNLLVLRFSLLKTIEIILLNPFLFVKPPSQQNHKMPIP